jgi:tripartite-type tricarboxylate transporter receptor subunit TctC
MPADVTARLHAALKALSADQSYIDRLTPLGYGAVSDDSAAAFASYIETDRPRWKAIVELSGARVE